MRRSTLARFALVGYGFNFTGIILSLMFRTWTMMFISGIFVAFYSWWFEKNYFDYVEKLNEEKKAD